MNKIEPLEKTSLPKIIEATPINAEVEIHADRIASFKSTVNRVNSKDGKTYRFDYTGVKNDYCTATRTA